MLQKELASALDALIVRFSARRHDSRIPPLPTGLELDDSHVRIALENLLNARVLEEVSARRAKFAWRSDEQGARFRLRLTDAGRELAARLATAAPNEELPAAGEVIATDAIQPGDAGQDECREPAAEPCQDQQDSPSESESSAAMASPETAMTDRISKIGTVLLALQNESGASLAGLMALTGWQVHTVRAALTRLRQKGSPIVKEKRDGETVYRVPGNPSGGA